MKNARGILLLLVLAALLPGQSAELTSHDAMMALLEGLAASSPLVSLQRIGTSVEGRGIPALFLSRGAFASGREKKPLVLVFCQQHGDEPSGKEAALLLAADLAGPGRKMLERLDLILVPSLNPDGSERRQRRNANDRDLNRNHVLLSEPEVVALHELFQRWFPEIVIDVHEYGAVSKRWIALGMLKNADEMLGWVSNLNIDAAIRSYSQDVFFPAMRQKVQRDGYVLFPYVVGAPGENERLRYSTTDIDDGRQGLGIYNTLAFILEGKGYGDVDNMLERRRAAQFSALKAFLEVCGEHGPEIMATVRAARSRLIGDVAPGERAYVRMDYFPDPEHPSIRFPVFNLEKWRAEFREWSCFEPLVKVKKSVPLPAAYVIPGGESALIDLLRRHGLRLHRLAAPAELELETTRVLHVAARLEEERTLPEYDLEKASARIRLPAGDVLVFLRQRGRLLIPLLLEPESSWGILTDTGGVPSRFAHYAREGKTYPVLRLMEKADLPLEEIKY
ncbi:MAG: hypothetical protein JXO51_04705 [Candidatus Aminicenantes bacterium]|nr:hypothetical protein [Candidatus Aminicenantes bacterium]